jgi:hypothetical protein
VFSSIYAARFGGMEYPALFYFGALRDLAELKVSLEEIDAAHKRAL